MTEIPNLKFHDGKTIPQLGFGIWNVPPEDTARAIEGAFEAGYRMIDGAYLYGNEAGMGEGLRQSGLARDEVFLTSKIWNFDHGRDRARASVERSLETIGIDALDLALIHWPVPDQDAYVETWEALIDMRAEGLVQSIGVSNFNADHLDRIISATGVIPVLNQIEIHPELVQTKMRAVNASHGIVTQSWTPLGQGRKFDAPPVAAAARRAGKSRAQVILRWHVQLGCAAIPRSVSPARQAENLDIFDFTLTEDEMAAISDLDIGRRTGPDPSVFKMM